MRQPARRHVERKKKQTRAVRTETVDVEFWVPNTELHLDGTIINLAYLDCKGQEQ
jgi:hypothetical protein